MCVTKNKKKLLCFHLSKIGIYIYFFLKQWIHLSGGGNIVPPSIHTSTEHGSTLGLVILS